MAGHNEAQSPESRSVTLALQGPKDWSTSAQSAPLESTSKFAVDLHHISEYRQLSVHAVNSSARMVTCWEVAVYFQDDTTGPELIPSVLTRNFCTHQTPSFKKPLSCCRPMEVREGIFAQAKHKNEHVLLDMGWPVEENRMGILPLDVASP